MNNVELFGDYLFGTRRVTGVNIRTRKVELSIGSVTDTARTRFASLGSNFLAVTGSERHQLTVFDRSGTVQNTIDIPGASGVTIGQQGPYVVGNALYIVSGPTLSKYRIADLLTPQAQPEWQKQFPGIAIGAMLAVDENQVYVSTNVETENTLYALDGSGQIRWKVAVAPASQVLSQILALGIYKDTLIASAGKAGLQAYHLADGSRAWNEFPNINICNAPDGRAPTAANMSIAGDKVFLGPFGGVCIHAFDANTGKVAWSFISPYRSTFDTTPLYVNGVVYATNGRLWAIDADTGKALAVSTEELGMNGGSPLVYDPVERQVIQWGLTGVHSYNPLR